MTVRRMCGRDLPAVAALEKECFSVPWTYEQLSESLSEKIYTFLVSEEAETGRVTGYVSMYAVLDEGDICNICVSEKERRKGTGSALLSALLEEAKRLGLSALTLEVRSQNEPARKLYEKYGFQPIGRRKGYYSLPEDDAVIYGVSLC